MCQDNLPSSRPGQASGDGGYTGMSPSQLWARTEEYTALPWVNNHSGNLQNCAKWNASAGKFEWKVNPDSDDDTDYSRGLSFQPSLLFIAKRVCEALGYACDFAVWEQSDYRFLFVMNTLPYAWAVRKWARALPHWSVNEFFRQLEDFLLFEFDIDHKARRVSCSASRDRVAAAGEACLSRVVDAFSVEVSADDENAAYKAMLNRGYAKAGHRMDRFYACDWYIRRNTRPDGSVIRTEYATLADLLGSDKLRADSVSDSGGGRSSAYPGGKWGLHYVRDIGTYFVLQVMKRVKYRKGQLVEYANWGNVCRLVPVNRFGDLVLNPDKEDDIEEMDIVPAWIDETDDAVGDVIFLDCGEDGSEDGVSGSYSHFGRRPGVEVVPQDTVLQFGAFSAVDGGETQGKGAVFDKLFVAYWDGGFAKFAPHLPHPWTDSFDTCYSWSAPNPDSKSGTLSVEWTVLRPSRPFSLRINSIGYGQGGERAAFTQVDLKKKYTFTFLADEIPDVRALFYMEGRKYLCERITATFSEDGMSRLLKGEFFKVV